MGIVGPNGCGKSNVMESVRWVLGESSAREMRGDSMQDVIFNGSGNRKPISRASVELIFDNSLGGASGEWSQYAEISVKRVIEREKGSSYYINNTPVRRRDVADLFLGTGLGGRAYAIIGQNTISRIVEAKPEELRIFLEEAAGISKYKERRRETELRLRDTWENLTRVEDIRREIDKQIGRLESQAAVTEQYHRLQAALKLAQGQFWLLKKQDAGLAWEKSKTQVEKLVNALEAQMAALRKIETHIENLRQQNYAGTELVQAAQTKYYETHAEVSNLENQVRNTQEARERLAAQLQQFTSQQQKLEAQAAALEESLKQLVVEQQEAAASELQTSESLQQIRKKLPEAEQAYFAAQHLHGAAHRMMNEVEQSIRLETSNLTHLDRTLSEFEQRLQRIGNELAALHLPDESVLLQKRQEHETAQNEVSLLEKKIADLRLQEQQQTEHIQVLRNNRLEEERIQAKIEAQIASIERIQQSLGHESKLDGWLKEIGLHNGERVWQKISIEPGWETALEAVLGVRLNAILKHDAGQPKVRPPATLVLCQPGIEGESSAQAEGKLLLSAIKTHESGLGAVMQDWLAGVYMLEAENPGVVRQQLKAGEMLVNRQGDVYTRHSVAFYTAQSTLHGVLERQKELEALKKELPHLRKKLEEASVAIQQTEQALQQTRLDHQKLQLSSRSATQSQHQLNLEIQRLVQQSAHAQERQKSLQGEQQSTYQRIAAIQAERKQKRAVIESARQSLGELQLKCDQAEAERKMSEVALSGIRNELGNAEKLAQEKTFNLKIIHNNFNEFNKKIKVINEELSALLQHKKETEALLEAAKTDSLKANLEAALTLKQQREAELAAARNTMAKTELELQSRERARMQTEQELHPLRDKLEQSRLQEQQTRLYFEQCQAELTANGIDEAILASSLPDNAKAGDLERQTSMFAIQITELGAVNLAAIQELVSERERKTYLDSQAADLEQAVATLEDAIQRIDKETRSRLQHTFDEANHHFNELFCTLFAGGQAQLQLLGEEILDTGIHVFAQPPGKKNSTIHLLSGGEKALTALALVFALFRLNPAPFCLMDEVDAPLDDSNTERFCGMVKKMSGNTQFLFVSHNKITMEMAQQLIGVTMQESGVSRIVDVDVETAMSMSETTV